MKKEGKKGTKKNRTRRRAYVYLSGLIVLSLLIAAAFYAPQIIFQVQDALLCGKTELSEREEMSAEALSTSYEKSLYQRMRNYAESLSAGEKFYTASQELTVDQEVYDYLLSTSGLYQNLLEFYWEAGLLPLFFYKGANINQWTQYVIYSDDYAKGVNFILWYIELQADTGEIMKLLVDGEDGICYAVKTENISSEYVSGATASYYVDNVLWTVSYMPELLFFWLSQYEILSQDPNLIDEIVAYIDAAETMDSSIIYEGYYPYYNNNVKSNSNKDITSEIPDNIGCTLEAGKMTFKLPYGETSLDILMEKNYDNAKSYINANPYINAYLNVTIGVRQIYEMIPEFA